MIIGPEKAEQLVRDTFGFGAKPLEPPPPSVEEKKVRMPKTTAELLKWLKRNRRKV